jgi:hypothetical protein
LLSQPGYGSAGAAKNYNSEMVTPSRIASINWRYPTMVFIAATIVCLPILTYGAPAGHSLGFNLVWLREFSAQLFAGEVYPRWLTNLNAGAGSPVFFFYAPLPFYVASIGSAFCIDCEISLRLGIGEWLLLSASGLSFYVFARTTAAPIAATIGAIIYMLLPYHFEYALWIRQSIGELGAYIWMPLILLYIQKISLRESGMSGLAICYALLIFTHLPAALLFSMFMLAYAVILSLPDKFLTVLPRFGAGVSAGILLASIYLVPALLNLEYVASERRWNDYYLYHRWFFLDGNKDPGPITDRLFPALLITTAIFATVWLVARRGSRESASRSAWPWILFVAMAWYLMTPLSKPLWELIPILQTVQFPWRVAIVLDIAVAITLVEAIQICTKTRQLASVLGLGLAALLFLYAAYGTGQSIMDLKLLKPMRTTEQIQRLQYRLSWRVGAREYFPIWVTRTPRQAREISAWMREVSLTKPTGEIEVVSWLPRRIEMDVELIGASYITVRQFYFPGWRARFIDGGDTGYLDVEPTYRNGFIGINARPGRYRLIVELIPRWPEYLGTAMSASAALLLFALGIMRRKRLASRKNSARH